jgi:hypothetical protein
VDGAEDGWGYRPLLPHLSSLTSSFYGDSTFVSFEGVCMLFHFIYFCVLVLELITIGGIVCKKSLLK